MKKFIALTVLALVFSTGFASAQGDVDDLCGKAATCMKNGDFKTAQTHLLQALKQDPNNETVVTAVAFASNRCGDYDTAITAGLHVLKNINDKSPLAYRELGYAFALKSAAARRGNDQANAEEYSKYATTCLVKSLELNKTDKFTWDVLIAHADASGDKTLADKARQVRQQVLGS